MGLIHHAVDSAHFALKLLLMPRDMRALPRLGAPNSAAVLFQFARILLIRYRLPGGIWERRLGMVYDILLAEDDEVNQEIVQGFLADYDQIVLTIVGDGRVALEVALTKRFDLLVIDQNMPYLNGDRLIRHLRAGDTLNSHSPIIRFTAAAAAVSVNSANQDSAPRDGVVPKPLRRDAFVSAIFSMLGKPVPK